MPRKDIEDKAKTAYKFAKSYNEYIEYFGNIKIQLEEGVKLYTELSENKELSTKQREEARKYAEQLRKFSDTIPSIKYTSLDVSSIDPNKIDEYTDAELEEYYNSIYDNKHIQEERINTTMQDLIDIRFDLYKYGGTSSSIDEKNSFNGSISSGKLSPDVKSLSAKCMGYAIRATQFITKQPLLLREINKYGSQLFQEENKFAKAEELSKIPSSETNLLAHMMEDLQEINKLQTLMDRLPSRIARIQELLGHDAAEVIALKEKASVIKQKQELISYLIDMGEKFKDAKDVDFASSYEFSRLKDLVGVYNDEVKTMVSDYNKQERAIKDTIYKNPIKKAFYSLRKHSLSKESRKSLFETKIDFKPTVAKSSMESMSVEKSEIEKQLIIAKETFDAILNSESGTNAYDKIFDSNMEFIDDDIDSKITQYVDRFNYYKDFSQKMAQAIEDKASPDVINNLLKECESLGNEAHHNIEIIDDAEQKPHYSFDR